MRARVRAARAAARVIDDLDTAAIAVSLMFVAAGFILLAVGASQRGWL